MTISAQAAAPSLAAQAADPIPASDGGPVPDDPVAAAMFTAHRVDEARQQLAHATERLQAAREASGDLRAYHCGHIARHLSSALDAGHLLAANLREHYPAESAELDKTTAVIGLARSVSESAKTATTAHLLQTILYDAGHASRHAQAMLDPGAQGDAEWSFNADHAGKHIGGAAEHVGKLAQHLTDNYPDEARWLAGLDEIMAGTEENGKQHARYAKGTVSAQMANPVTDGSPMGALTALHARAVAQVERLAEMMGQIESKTISGQASQDAGVS